MTSGLIVNPRSGRSNDKGVELARMLAGKPGVSIYILENFRQIDTALEDCAAKGVANLFISSGDGTIQEIQTQVSERGLFNEPRRGSPSCHTARPT